MADTMDRGTLSGSMDVSGADMGSRAPGGAERARAGWSSIAPGEGGRFIRAARVAVRQAVANSRKASGAWRTEERMLPPVELLEAARRALLDGGANERASNLVLGVDKDGGRFMATTDKLPHALIAGREDTDIGLHLLLTGILLGYSPEQMRFLLIDSQRGELAAYDGLPHLLAPVVRESEKAAHALRAVQDEIDRRTALFATQGESEITGFNAWAPCAGQERLPRIVVAVAELADLMLDSHKAEKAMANIAQKGPAAGVHLILATRNPTRNVLSARVMINVPVRYAMRTASQTESRAILGAPGAEQLGKGEMLVGGYGFKDPQWPARHSRLVRACGVSRPEVERVVDFWKARRPFVADAGFEFLGRE